MSRISLLVIILLSLTACGFQLRGATELPTELQPVYLYDGGDDELQEELVALLRTNHVLQADTEQHAASSLKIIRQKQSRRVISVDSHGRAREYELLYTVEYAFKGAQIDANNVVKLQRELLFDPENVLGASHEEQTLYRDMKRDAARMILQRLEAVKPVKNIVP